MTDASKPDPRPAPELAQVVSVPRDEPATIGGQPFDAARLAGLRHGRLGLGLGGGLS